MTHPTDIGQKTEAIVLAELVKRDHVVLTPFGSNHRYDLVVDDGGKFVRVQCKTGRLLDGKITFNGYSVPGQGKAGRLYTDEVDVFAVYCPQTDKTYWVPVEEVGFSPYLRVDPPKNNQTKGVRWAKDYELA